MYQVFEILTLDVSTSFLYKSKYFLAEFCHEKSKAMPAFCIAAQREW